MSDPLRTRALVLLVDDEAELLELFALILTRKPYDVLKAKNGPEAMQVLEATIPDLVLLDVAMPGMSGLEVLQAIRNNPRLEGTRVALLTAVPTMIDPLNAKLADIVLTKPIAPRVLEEAVSRLLA